MLAKEVVMQKLRKYFLTRREVIAVYVFGSLVRGTFTDNSDIDLGLMLKDDQDKISAFDLKLELMEELENLLDCEVDIVIFSQADLRMQHQMLKGELILGKNNRQRIRREQRLLDMYFDMRYFYDQYEEKLGKGL